MDGILNVNKPSGITSFGVVAVVKRLTSERHVGHAGTLDPLATGVLPICFGQGTRVIEFLAEASKAYRAYIELGVATDTYDASGKITQRGDASKTSRSQFESALTSFRGAIEQLPPMYSAVRYKGKRLYELARAGIEVKRRSRLITIHHLELVDWQPPVACIEVVCDKGTYIRSLAHDLGQVLGCGANLKNLIRLRCGLFDIRDAVSLSQLEEAVRFGYWQSLVYPIDAVLLNLAAVVVSDEEGKALKNGRPLLLESSRLGQPVPVQSLFGNRCRAYTTDGSFLGVLRFDLEKGQWQPEKVFLSP